MTVGISTAHANSTLDTMGAAYTHLALHTADPGASGTTSASSVTTRAAVTWASASGGSKLANGTLPSWASWAGTNGEVVSHVSFWNASSAGTFARSAALSSTVTMNTGNTLNITGITVTLTPLAA